LALIVWLLPTADLISSVRRVEGLRWASILLALALLQLAAVAKWRLLVMAAGERCRPRDLLQAHGAGLFANNFLPSLVGGDVLRAGLLVRRGLRADVLLVGGVADRAVDASALVLIAAVAGLFAPVGANTRSWRLLSTVSFLLIVGLAVGGFLLERINRSRLPSGLRKVAGDARTAVRALLAHPGAALGALSIALFIQSTLVALNVWLGQAMGLMIPLAAWFLVWPLAKLLALVPISLGGLGVRQMAMAGLLVPLAVEPTLVVAQSLVWESLLLGLGVVGGVVSIWLPGSESAAIRAEASD
jgi:uncharacterized protein (TIRG00374 family)